MVALTPKAFDTLLILIENSGRLVGKEELMERLWPETFVEEVNLAHHVSVLRKTFEGCANGNKYIQTVPRRGYRFIGDVKRVPDQSEALTLRPERESTDLSVDEKQPAPAIDTQTAGTRTVNQIKRHKRAVALVILGMLAVAAVLWYALSRHIPAAKETSLKNLTFTPLTDQSGPEYFPSLSPDGKLFVYAGHASGKWDIYLQRVGGQNPIDLTRDSSANDTEPAFSPDGEHIAFRSEREGGGIFVMGATGENVRRLTDFGFNPAWSPDGKEIACTEQNALDPTVRSGSSSLWVVNVASGEKRLLTKGGNLAQPAWSPHGDRIAYWGGSPASSSNRAIWTIPSSGGEPGLVIQDSAVNWNPTWSPNGNYLYFLSDRGGSMNLWRVPIQEQTGNLLGPAEAITTPAPSMAHLSFSADGRRIAYVQVIKRTNLQRVEFDPERETVTGQPVWITKDSVAATFPDLSPDGEWIVHDSFGEKQENLYMIRRDGSGGRQLTDDVYKPRTPRWSPDGKEIVFFGNRNGISQIWIVKPDGSPPRQLTYLPDGATRPVWSPDGARLICDHSSEGKPFIMEVGKPWNEQTPQAIPPWTDSFRWYVRSWSTDGTKLAGGQAPPPPSSGIVVYSLATQQYSKLTDFGDLPRWLSDSRRVMFRMSGKLFLVDSQTQKFREVLSVEPNSFMGFTLSRDDRTIYFSLETVEADIWMMTLNE